MKEGNEERKKGKAMKQGKEMKDGWKEGNEGEK